MKQLKKWIVILEVGYKIFEDEGFMSPHPLT